MIRSCHYCLVYLDIIDIVINIICRSCDWSMPGPDTGHTADTGTMWVALPACPAACETAALQQQPVLSNLYTQASDVLLRITIIPNNFNAF